MFGIKKKKVNLEDKQDKLPLNAKTLFTFLTSKIIKRLDQGIRVKNLPEVQKIKGKVELVDGDGKTKEVSIYDLDKALQDEDKWMYVKILEDDRKDFVNALSRAIVNEPSFFDGDGSPARGRVDDDGTVWVNIKEGVTLDSYAFQKDDGTDARAKVDNNEQLIVLSFQKDDGGAVRGSVDDDGKVRVNVKESILPDGAAVSNKQDIGNSVLTSINGKTTKVDTDDVAITSMPIYTTSAIQNVNLADKTLWYEITLPVNTRAFTLKLRDTDYGFYYDFTAAHTTYMTADSGERINISDCYPEKIYVRCSEADSQVAELLTWTD